MIRNFARNRNTERKPVEVTERADFAAKTFRAGNGWDMGAYNHNCAPAPKSN